MRGFPIHPCDKGNKNIYEIKCIPWEAIQPHEEQAMKNHGQSLERLAERGGLSFYEAYCVLCDSDWGQTPYNHTDKQYMLAVMRMIGLYYCRQSEEE